MLEVISREPKERKHDTPLLFIHGAWHGAWCWDEFFLPYFSEKGWAAHALSLRGHGRSSGHDKIRWHSIKNYVEDVATVANNLSQAPVVVGHSMGGLVVQKYLETHYAPAGVLLASCPPQGVFRTTLNILRNQPLSFLKANVTMSLYPIIGSRSLTHELFFSEEMPSEKVAYYFEKMQDESYRVFLDMLVLNLPKPELIKVPLLVLGGRHDNIFTVKEVEATAVAYQTEAHLYDMAHDMQLEVGWQAVAEHIISWLAEQKL